MKQYCIKSKDDRFYKEVQNFPLGPQRKSSIADSSHLELPRSHLILWRQEETGIPWDKMFWPCIGRVGIRLLQLTLWIFLFSEFHFPSLQNVVIKYDVTGLCDIEVVWFHYLTNALWYWAKEPLQTNDNLSYTHMHETKHVCLQQAQGLPSQICRHDI